MTPVWMQPGECGDTPSWAVSYSCTSQSRDCQNPCPEIDQRGETSSSVNQSLLRQGPTVLQLEQLERQRHPELRRWSCTGGGQSQQPQRFVYLTDLGKGGRYLAVFTFFFFCWTCHVVCSEEVLLCLRVFYCLFVAFGWASHVLFLGEKTKWMSWGSLHIVRRMWVIHP